MKKFSYRLYFTLVVAGLLASAAVIPYVFSSQNIAASELSVPLTTVVGLMVVQSAIILLVAVFVGQLLSADAKIGLPYLGPLLSGKKPAPRFWRTVGFAVLLGVAVTAIVLLLDTLVFGTNLVLGLRGSNAYPLGERALATFYGGITEELLMRYFLMTVLAWIFLRLFKGWKKRGVAWAFWTAILLTAVIFAVGHLPFAGSFEQVSSQIVLRALILNGIAGAVFGWLYWKRGLEAAMIAHFTSDVTLLVLLPAASLLVRA